MPDCYHGHENHSIYPSPLSRDSDSGALSSNSHNLLFLKQLF